MKLFAIGKKYAAIISTILVMFVFAAVYFFIYLPNNEKRLQDQSFRSLQRIDQNIHDKIDNSIVLLKNLLHAFKNKSINQKLYSQYLQSFSPDNFTLVPPVAISANDSLRQQIQKTGGTLVQIVVDDALQQFSLNLFEERNEREIIRISMRFKFEQFIQPLLPRRIFDEYIILGNKHVVFETFPSGLIYFNKDSLLSIKNGLGVSASSDKTIGGVKYKTFLQPVTFDAINQWIIVGLFADERYRQEKNQLPFSLVLILITIAFTIVVALPWVKLFHMGNKDRVTIVDGILSICVAILLTSLLFLLFFKYNYSFRPNNIPDSKDVLSKRL